jgi:hypothetical protein
VSHEPVLYLKQPPDRFFEKQDRLNGLLSFSKNWTSPVLWSHYGAKYRLFLIHIPIYS